MPLFIAVLLGLTGAIIVTFPLLGLTRDQQAVNQAGNALGEVAEREQAARLALREVELDYTLGNLDSGDYDALRGRYERRALAALRTRYQREQELDAQIERELDALRSKPAAAGRAAMLKSAALTTAPAPTKAPNSTKPAAASVKPAVNGPRAARQLAPRERRNSAKRKGGA